MQVEDWEYYDEDHAEAGHNEHNKVEHVLLVPGIGYLVDAVEVLPPVPYFHVKQLPVPFLAFPTVQGVGRNCGEGCEFNIHFKGEAGYGFNHHKRWGVLNQYKITMMMYL